MQVGEGERNPLTTRESTITSVNTKGKRWCFTWNNPPENWQVVLSAEEQIEDEDGPASVLRRSVVQKIKKLVAEEEFAPSTGTKHIQGYVHFETQFWRNTLMTAFGGNIYFISARGTELDNYKYCTKTGRNVLKIGEFTQETEKWVSKLQRTKQMLEDVTSLTWMEFTEKWPLEAFHQRNKLLDWKSDHIKKHNAWDGDLRKKNWWIWGPPGVGKSRWVRSQFEPNEICTKWQNKWFDGYDDLETKCILFEDVDPDKIKVLMTFLKTWADRYYQTQEIKGAKTVINPGKWFIVITANYSMEECIENNIDLQALKRRFSEVEIKDSNDIYLNTRLDRSILMN